MKGLAAPLRRWRIGFVAAIIASGFVAAPAMASDAYVDVFSPKTGYIAGTGIFWDSNSMCGSESIIAQDKATDGYAIQVDVWYWNYNGNYYKYVDQVQTTAGDDELGLCVQIPEDAPVKLRVCVDNANISPTACKYSYPKA